MVNQYKGPTLVTTTQSRDRRALKIGVITTKWGKTLRVLSQTHRCDKFTEEGMNFVASNGFVLSSYMYPGVVINGSGAADTLFVRGAYVNQDCLPVYVPFDAWLNALRIAVKEYNALESISKEEEIEVIE